VVLPVKDVEGILTDETSYNFSWCPYRSLTYLQKLDPVHKSLLTKLCLSFFRAYLNRHVELTSFLSILTSGILNLDFKTKVVLLNLKQALFPQQNKLVIGYLICRKWLCIKFQGRNIVYCQNCKVKLLRRVVACLKLKVSMLTKRLTKRVLIFVFTKICDRRHVKVGLAVVNL